MQRDTHYYVYKMTTDNGGAPCVVAGQLTLAICKPGIRSTAKVGDWLFGFGGEDLGGRLIYIAEVTGKTIGGEYYRPEANARRRDQIYKWDGDTLRWKTGARYHHDGCEAGRDIGEHPHYRRANVLYSSRGKFRYLGDKGDVIAPGRFKEITALLSGLKQGHRVHDHPQELLKELTELRDAIFSRFTQSTVGQPSHGDHRRPCSGSEGGASIGGGCVKPLEE